MSTNHAHLKGTAACHIRAGVAGGRAPRRHAEHKLINNKGTARLTSARLLQRVLPPVDTKLPGGACRGMSTSAASAAAPASGLARKGHTDTPENMWLQHPNSSATLPRKTLRLQGKTKPSGARNNNVVLMRAQFEARTNHCTAAAHQHMIQLPIQQSKQSAAHLVCASAKVQILLSALMPQLREAGQCTPCKKEGNPARRRATTASCQIPHAGTGGALTKNIRAQVQTKASPNCTAQ